MVTDDSRPEERTSRKKVCAMTLITLIGSGTLALLVAEVGLRLFRPQPVGVSSRQAGSIPVHTPNHVFHYQTDEFDVTTRFNSLGLRDGEVDREKPENTFRVLALGDSITEALQVQDHEVYTEVLEASLNASASASATRYEVVNAGISGFGVGDELRMFEYLGRDLDPDLVIVQLSLINDLSEDRYARWFRVEKGGEVVEREEAVPGWGDRALESLAQRSHLAQALLHARKLLVGSESDRLKNIARHKRRYHDLLYAVAGSEADFSEDWRTTFAFLRELHKRSTELGAGFLVLVRPLDLDILDDRKSLYPRDILFEFLEETGIEYLDLTPVFVEKSGRDLSQIRFEVDSHWIPQAHLWVAEALFERIGE